MLLLSVIIPVYKVESYLDQCVESILAQTYTNLEVILVDDGSPDRCGAMCDIWAAKDSRIRVIHKENGGVCSARNAGLDAARGEFVAFVDSDDWLDPGMYDAMMAQIREHGCDIVLCDCLKEFPEGAQLFTHPIRPGLYDREELKIEYFPHLLMMENVEYPATISNWLLVFRRDLAENVRYLTGVRYSEDLLFGAQLMYRAKSFCYLKGQAFYHYRMNPTSASHSFVPDKWNDYRKLHAGIKDAFGNCAGYNFSRQIDLCLLFFLYNAVGDLYGAPLERREKKHMILAILNDPEVRDMFRRLDIGNLSISAKQKVITLFYRLRIGISALIRYYGG